MGGGCSGGVDPAISSARTLNVAWRHNAAWQVEGLDPRTKQRPDPRIVCSGGVLLADVVAPSYADSQSHRSPWICCAEAAEYVELCRLGAGVACGLLRGLAHTIGEEGER